MAKHTVITMPGDGIGNQVLPEALRVLKAVGFDAEYIHADIGWEIWREEGNALPQRTIDLLSKHNWGCSARSHQNLIKKLKTNLSPNWATRNSFTTDRT